MSIWIIEVSGQRSTAYGSIRMNESKSKGHSLAMNLRVNNNSHVTNASKRSNSTEVVRRPI